MPEYALGGIPPGFGIVVEGEPSEVSCTTTTKNNEPTISTHTDFKFCTYITITQNHVDY